MNCIAVEKNDWMFSVTNGFQTMTMVVWVKLFWALINDRLSVTGCCFFILCHKTIMFSWFIPKRMFLLSWCRYNVYNKTPQVIIQRTKMLQMRLAQCQNGISFYSNKITHRQPALIYYNFREPYTKCSAQWAPYLFILCGSVLLCIRVCAFLHLFLNENIFVNTYVVSGTHIVKCSYVNA